LFLFDISIHYLLYLCNIFDKKQFMLELYCVLFFEVNFMNEVNTTDDSLLSLYQIEKICEAYSVFANTCEALDLACRPQYIDTIVVGLHGTLRLEMRPCAECCITMYTTHSPSTELVSAHLLLGSSVEKTLNLWKRIKTSPYPLSVFEELSESATTLN
jgi:hypothetical protein